MKVNGWVRAAIAVSATTKGSKPEIIWETSASTAIADPVLGFVPYDSNMKLPSLLCNPTFPMKGYDVEHANAAEAPPPIEEGFLITGEEIRGF